MSRNLHGDNLLVLGAVNFRVRRILQTESLLNLVVVATQILLIETIAVAAVLCDQWLALTVQWVGMFLAV